ncbi:MAG: replicative DNA helicase [Planctomycetia bacterium]|nr:replicative DNA helicase [Planctomycetia bacterium]
MAKQTAKRDVPLLDKVPPHSDEAEMAVLGSMMLDRDAIGTVSQFLEADVFYTPQHGILFQVLLELYDKNHPIDLVTVQEELRRQNQLDSVGGTAYIAELAGSVPSAASAEFYANIVKQKALLRGLIDSAGQILRDAYQSTDETDTILDRSEQRIFAVTEKKVVGEATHIRPILQDVFNRLDVQGNNPLTGLSTGFFELDDLTRGLQPGELIVLAARPSMGKSALALNIAEHVAIAPGRPETERKPVVLFSLEMGKQELALRLVCSHFKFDAQALRKGMLNKEEGMRLHSEVGLLYDIPLYIDDTPAMRILDLRAKCRRLKARHDIQLAIVDYLQLLRQPGAESRQIEVSMISQGLKALARELNIPILAVAQLRRASEEHNRPRLSDLRESGAIEQDADVVLLLHREEYYKPDDPNLKGKAKLIIAKQRNGPTGDINLSWLRRSVRFENLSPYQEPAPAYSEDAAPF